MRKQLAHVMVVLALIGAIGGHWAIVQSVAWVGMAINYSQDAPLRVALAKTFDGQHPCKLCKVVQAGKQQEKKQAAQKVQTKLDLICFRCELAFSPPLLPAFHGHHWDVLVSRSETPPTPPPRSA